MLRLIGRFYKGSFRLAGLYGIGRFLAEIEQALFVCGQLPGFRQLAQLHADADESVLNPSHDCTAGNSQLAPNTERSMGSAATSSRRLPCCQNS